MARVCGASANNKIENFFLSIFNITCVLTKLKRNFYNFLAFLHIFPFLAWKVSKFPNFGQKNGQKRIFFQFFGALILYVGFTY